MLLILTCYIEQSSHVIKVLKCTDMIFPSPVNFTLGKLYCWSPKLFLPQETPAPYDEGLHTMLSFLAKRSFATGFAFSGGTRHVHISLHLCDHLSSYPSSIVSKIKSFIAHAFFFFASLLIINKIRETERFTKPPGTKSLWTVATCLIFHFATGNIAIITYCGTFSRLKSCMALSCP